MPLFSIVIPCRNASRTLPETLAALRAQSFTDWEAVCVNHGSDDDTAAVIDRVARLDPRVRRIEAGKLGPGQARNIGAMRAATGEILCFLDARDAWAPDRLAHLAARFEEADRPDMVIGAVQRQAAAPCPPVAPRRAPGVASALAGAPTLALSNIALRREFFLLAGGFDAGLPAAEEVEWLVRLLACRPAVGIARQAVTLLRARPAMTEAEQDALLLGWGEAVETARILGVAPEPSVLARARAEQQHILNARGRVEQPCAAGNAAGNAAGTAAARPRVGFGAALRQAAEAFRRAPEDAARRVAR